jgi:hypothetical protein
VVDVLGGGFEAGEEVRRFQEREILENLLLRGATRQHVQHVLDPEAVQFLVHVFS